MNLICYPEGFLVIPSARIAVYASFPVQAEEERGKGEKKEAALNRQHHPPPQRVQPAKPLFHELLSFPFPLSTKASGGVDTSDVDTVTGPGDPEPARPSARSSSLIGLPDSLPPSPA